MLANENPGTCGVAARLPKKPGTQKLTPPSAARELVAIKPTTAPAIGNATTLAATFRRTNDERQNFSVKNQDRAPFPGESLLIFASVLAGRGEMSLPSLLIFAWGGSVVGDNLGYLVGRKLGRGTILRYGAKVGLTDERVKGIEHVYVRYGSATVLFARFFSILRQLNGIVAGMLGMSWWRFVLLDAVGAALWVTIWVFAPAYFSEHLTFIVALAHHTKVVASFLLAIGLMLVLGLFIRRLRVAGWTVRR